MTANYVDSTGLHTQSLNDLVAQLEASFRAIYGADINLQPNSPDAQMINIFAQVVADTIDCVTQVYTSFDPSQAIGVALDQRCAINGVVRQGATFTRTNVMITVDRAVTLTGLDTSEAGAFIVSNLTNNRFALALTTAFASAGTYEAEFISVIPGEIETVPNTITTISTPILGVTAVNNPDSAIVTGANQETDISLRGRRAASVALPSQGYLAGLTGALVDLPNVLYTRVYENDSDVTDPNGIPAHSIWCVVDGGDTNDIAQVIYNKRNAGCGLKGAVAVSVPQVNGFDFTVLFDRPDYIELYIQLTIESINPAHVVDPVFLAQQIYDQIQYGIYEPGDYTEITTVVKQSDPLAVVLNGGVSVDGITFSPFIYPATLQGRFLLSIPKINIIVV